MSKRNIKGKSGKQLYLNEIFNHGMLFTSSEMPEGYAKVINNFDIVPSGDAAIPRKPYALNPQSVIDANEYIYPVRFSQALNTQHYIKFNNVISEKDFAEDNVVNTYEEGSKSIEMWSKLDNTDIIEKEVVINNDPNFTLEIDIQFQNDVLIVDDKTYQDHTDPSDNEALIACSFTEYHDWNNFGIIDADTVKVDSSYYRLIGIDAPEKNQKWYEYGKKFLETLCLNVIFNFGGSVWIYGIKDENGEPLEDNTDSKRTLAYLFLEINGRYYLVQNILLCEGLAKVRYVYDGYPYVNDLIAFQNIAITNNTRIHNYNQYDPLYSYEKNKVIMPNEDFIIEVVAIRDSKLINQKVSSIVNDVKYIYIDYLDAVGFIGRVINVNTNSIVYKGLILLKSDFGGNDNLFFKIELPPNDYEGDKIELYLAATNGYNLYNNNIINVENTTDYSMPTIIKSIVVTQPSESLSDIIVDQAVVNSDVKLHAIINETYFPFDFKANLKRELENTITIIHDIECVCETYGSTLFDVHKNKVNLRELQLKGKRNYYLEFPDTDLGMGVIRKGIHRLDISLTNFNIDSTKFNRRFNISDSVKKSIWFNTYTAGEQIFNLPLCPSGLMTLKVIFKSITPGSTDVIDGFNGLQDLTSFTEIVIEAEVVYNMESEYVTSHLSSKWEYAPYGGSDYTIIKDHYITHNVIDSKVERVESEDLKWRIPVAYNVILKYSLTPTYKIIFDFKEEPEIFQNELLSSSLAYPLLKIGTEYKTLSNNDLKRNLNIKNATRVGIFNRQICLYGDYTKTNTLFFSAFEKPWYYPFPNGAVDLPEDIVFSQNYNEQLVVFGKNNIYMLTTDSTVTESVLKQIYSNLSIHSSDINLTSTFGTNLLFFNEGMGYVAYTNQYYNDPTNIKISKLTESIHNCLVNPEYIIRVTNKIPVSDYISRISVESNLFIDVVNINLVQNYSYAINNVIYRSVVIFKYNQQYKYWSMYSFNKDMVAKILSPYTAEPHLGYQFMILDQNNNFNILKLNDSIGEYEDTGIGLQKYPIECLIDSGFLSIDVLSDKRFKDLLFTFNNINGKASIKIECIFFIDSTPILLGSDTSPIVVDNYGNESDLSDSGYSEGDIVFTHEQYGTSLEIKGEHFTTSSRCTLRIPVYGKGRLPSFVIRMRANNLFELLNYSLIYKEKDINRRR